MAKKVFRFTVRHSSTPKRSDTGDNAELPLIIRDSDWHAYVVSFFNISVLGVRSQSREYESTNKVGASNQDVDSLGEMAWLSLVGVRR